LGVFKADNKDDGIEVCLVAQEGDHEEVTMVAGRINGVCTQNQVTLADKLQDAGVPVPNCASVWQGSNGTIYIKSNEMTTIIKPDLSMSYTTPCGEKGGIGYGCQNTYSVTPSWWQEVDRDKLHALISKTSGSKDALKPSPCLWQRVARSSIKAILPSAISAIIPGPAVRLIESVVRVFPVLSTIGNPPLITKER